MSLALPILDDLLSRSRMGKISVNQAPNLDPSLARTSGGGGPWTGWNHRIMHLSDRPAGRGGPSSQAFRTSRMLIEMSSCQFRYSGGQSPLITVAMLAIDLARASPRGGAEADFEAMLIYKGRCDVVSSWLSWSNRQTLMRGFAVI